MLGFEKTDDVSKFSLANYRESRYTFVAEFHMLFDKLEKKMYKQYNLTGITCIYLR